MGWGSKTTSTSNQSQTGSSTQTPIEAQYMEQFRKGLLPEFQGLLGLAKQPVYGDAQKASILNDVNELTKASTQKLMSTLGARGTLDSGALAGGVGQLESNRLSELTKYLTGIPAAEREAKMRGLSGVLGMGMEWAGRAPVGQTSTSTGSSTGTQTQTQSPGFSSLVGPLLGLGLSGLTGGMSGGLGGLFGRGGSVGQNSALLPSNPYGSLYGSNVYR